jgi:hypothetical protein
MERDAGKKIRGHDLSSSLVDLADPLGEREGDHGGERRSLDSSRDLYGFREAEGNIG